MRTTVAVRIEPGLDEVDGRHPVEDPPGLVCFGQETFVEEPPEGEATVDGLPVIVLQVINDRDSFRLKSGGPIYTECRRAVKRVAGEGRICGFTGVPIEGPALECPCGCVVRAEVADNPDTAFCPQCGADLPRPQEESNTHE